MISKINTYHFSWALGVYLPLTGDLWRSWARPSLTSRPIPVNEYLWADQTGLVLRCWPSRPLLYSLYCLLPSCDRQTDRTPTGWPRVCFSLVPHSVSGVLRLYNPPPFCVNFQDRHGERHKDSRLNLRPPSHSATYATVSAWHHQPEKLILDSCGYEATVSPLLLSWTTQHGRATSSCTVSLCQHQRCSDPLS